MINNLPNISWPEKSNMELEQQVIVKISKLIEEHVGEIESTGNAIYILVPDPPDDVIPIADWINEQIQKGLAREESRYELLHWGVRGTAIVVFNKNLFICLLESVFRLSCNTTTLIAAERLDFIQGLKHFVPPFIKSLLANDPTSTHQIGYYYGLLFDWGDLIEIFEGQGKDDMR